ncbi:hypothetical protein Mapa_016122 [Marchantia paleacea]|nr:hypothetical protein Mapa_016122 [Marchantia paleacea]
MAITCVVTESCLASTQSGANYVQVKIFSTLKPYTLQVSNKPWAKSLLLKNHLHGALITVRQESVTLLVIFVEGQLGDQPFGKSNNITLIKVGAIITILRSHHDGSFGNVNLLIDLPFVTVRYVGTALPFRPPLHAELLQPLSGDVLLVLNFEPLFHRFQHPGKGAHLSRNRPRSPCHRRHNRASQLHPSRPRNSSVERHQSASRCADRSSSGSSRGHSTSPQLDSTAKFNKRQADSASLK